MADLIPTSYLGLRFSLIGCSFERNYGYELASGNRRLHSCILRKMNGGSCAGYDEKELKVDDR